MWELKQELFDEIEDLFDQFPGGYPRSDLDRHIEKAGFEIRGKHIVFSEPFSLDGLRGPLKLWPILKDQNIFAVRR